MLVLSPFVPRALRAFARCPVRVQVATVAIGVGASAVATAMFTKSIALANESQDFVAPYVLQKAQPLFAIALAVIVLHERIRPSYALFAVPALGGAWMLTFADPTDVRVSEAKPALFALGAAVLWGAGTVLGRLVGQSLDSRDITVLRFVFGLIGAAIVAQVTGAATWPGWNNALGLILLALIPGLIALRLYYFALARTPASRATIAELANPVTIIVVIALFVGGAPLDGSQWVGLAIFVMTVLGLSWHEQRRRPAVEAPAPETLAATH